ncbi:hypothetical protein LK09_00430 [Microbacterium mangrovi]|uniref:RNA-binding protein n=1 Tax=Microbacterium mangrovi TaxID=1348253 RepID=A0A0B2ADT9_9MICO|nr:hypothetical protein [Microbacterium mangrovi]KHK99845.1 hypothetical protein LK09_00430 [Microbacterium mangrovi]
MALRHPEDLAAWQRWQAGRNRLRSVRHALRRPAPPALWLHLRGYAPVVLFALDASTPTAVASLAAPLAHTGDAHVAVLAPQDMSARLPGTWAVARLDPHSAPPVWLGTPHTVVATGHFLPAGAAAYRWAGALGARFLVVQHGLLTPQMAPLPRGAHLLAFSEQDADFWRSGRADVTSEVVGSELLWSAAQRPAADLVDGAPVFLGQLHGAELPRSISGGTAFTFCRGHHAVYRPHPAETDKRSRWAHACWRARGIRFAEPGSLLDEPRPVVSIFSTGVLEAAAAGIPAWVTCVRPPAWLQEFWERYGLRLWGGEPTPAPALPRIEPARAIAERVLSEGGPK